MDRMLNSDELPTMKELLMEIDENGGTDAALAGLREKQYRQYCCELIWRYPISQGDSAGGFLMPVREGILWIPYDEMEKEAGEVLRTCDAVLLDEAACRTYAEDFRAYADELCNALRQSAYICRGTGRGNHDENIIDLGAFEMVSDRMAVSDPCYDTDVWCRGELEGVLPGIWEASVVKRDEGDWGMRTAILDALGAALHLSREVLFHIDYQSLAEIIMKRLNSPEEEGVGEALEILAVPYLRAMKKIKEGT